MLMYDCLKKEVKSKLVFQFIKNIKRPQYIEILKFKKEISPNADEIEVDFFDSSINDYKIYDCNTKFTEKEEPILYRCIIIKRTISIVEMESTQSKLFFLIL